MNKKSNKRPWNFIDLTGKKFNKLTIIKYDGNQTKKNGKKSSVWSCQCDCGKICKKTTQNLNAGAISCGCVMRLSTHGHNFNPNRKDQYIKSLFRILKRNAKDRNIDFNLSIENITNLCFLNCYYCNSPPNEQVTSTNKHTKNTHYHNGLDRIDSNLEYEINNVVPCCKNCNYAKRTLSQKDFYDWLITCYNNLLNKGVIK